MAMRCRITAVAMAATFFAADIDLALNERVRFRRHDEGPARRADPAPKVSHFFHEVEGVFYPWAAKSGQSAPA